MRKAIVSASMFLISATLPLSSYAESFQFKCFSYGGGDRYTMSLSLNEKAAEADIVEEQWDNGRLGGAINPKYRSRGDVRYVKFGYQLIVEESLLSGGKTLRDGSLGGFVRVEGVMEGGFYQYKFVCKR